MSKRINIMSAWKEFNPSAKRSIKEDFDTYASLFSNKILAYLDKGEIILASPGRAIDVLSGEEINQTNNILTDGEYYWPSSLGYYIRKYNLRIPKEFEDKILGTENKQEQREPVMRNRILMNKDIETMSYYYDNDNAVIFNIEVLNNDYLPFELKDYIQDSQTADQTKNFIQNAVVSDFFASRTLNLARDNAKAILNAAALPQGMRTSDKLRITDACRGVTMTDSFWIKEKGENITFDEVNIRKRHLSEVSYKIAILGQHISATRDELVPDLSTEGMFPKYWKRENGKVYLYKTDNFKDNISTRAELESSRILEEAGINAVRYFSKTIDGRLFAVSECIASDDISLVSMQSVKDYCTHTKQDFYDFLLREFGTQFSNMCITDYVIANTDRHFLNFGVLVDNSTNKIISFAPLFDHNQSLIIDEMQKSDSLDELIYEPADRTFIETVNEYAKYSDCDFSNVKMPDGCKRRWDEVVKRRQGDKEMTVDSDDLVMDGI